MKWFSRPQAPAVKAPTSEELLRKALDKSSNDIRVLERKNELLVQRLKDYEKSLGSVGLAIAHRPTLLILLVLAGAVLLGGLAWLDDRRPNLVLYGLGLLSALVIVGATTRARWLCWPLTSAGGWIPRRFGADRMAGSA